MDVCPRHPDGHECSRTGTHTLHRAQIGFEWVTWGEPEPVSMFVASKKGRRNKKGLSDAELIAGIHRVTGTAPSALHHEDDHGTSEKAAKSVAPRTGTQKYELLVAYSTTDGLTDDVAAEMAGLIHRPGCCWWHRCSDLRDDGFIEPTGEERTSPHTGEERMVCRITRAGLAALGV